ncbi:MAG: hypothetical protein HYZ83_04075 [Candidatus Omnitrophica bacterium]|nr:hypothetical protein [Candidatus Omnitrophota bacterium]
MKQKEKKPSENSFPSEGWERSPYRFLKFEDVDGSKVEFDFWRELANINFPELNHPISLGAHLKKSENQKLIVEIWAEKIKNFNDKQQEKIFSLINNALRKAGYIVEMKGIWKP